MRTLPGQGASKRREPLTARWVESDSPQQRKLPTLPIWRFPAVNDGSGKAKAGRPPEPRPAGMAITDFEHLPITICPPYRANDSESRIPTGNFPAPARPPASVMHRKA